MMDLGIIELTRTYRDSSVSLLPFGRGKDAAFDKYLIAVELVFLMRLEQM
jgi:hypothetical protein